MKITKENAHGREIPVFGYEGKHLQAGERERIISAYREHKANVSNSEEHRLQPEDELRLLLASLARTPEELSRLLAIEANRAGLRELAETS